MSDPAGPELRAVELLEHFRFSMRGIRRVVEITLDGAPLVNEIVTTVEPLLDDRRKEELTDPRGRITHRQRHEKGGELPAPRPFFVEVRGKRFDFQ